jgi:type I restriction enzyme S subunit
MEQGELSWITNFIWGIADDVLREQFLKIKVLCPPVKEQVAIVESVGKDTADARLAIEVASGQIALLLDYRTRLIADVVTGKLDVREAAARLPEDVPEPEAGEAVDGESDADEPSDEPDAAPEDAEA